jgi:acetyl-CoA hydrolase
MAQRFASRDRADWCALLEGSDACWAPVLAPDEAAVHPHMAARGTYVCVDGALQAAPAPRFSATPSPQPGPVPAPGSHSRSVLQGLGFSDTELDRLVQC